MQTPVDLTIGTAGLTVPRLPGPVAPSIDRDHLPVKAICVYPELTSSTITNAISIDGDTWFDNVVGAALSTYTGPGIKVYEPLMPGMKFRITSSETQGDTKSTLVPHATDADAEVKFTANAYGDLGDLVSVAISAPDGAASLGIYTDPDTQTIIIDPEASAAVASSATVGGLLWTATTPGVAGDTISVTQSAGADGVLAATMTGTAPNYDIAVQLGTTSSAKSAIDCGGLTFTSTNAGVAGDSTRVKVLGGVNQTLHASHSNADVTVQLGTTNTAKSSGTVGGIVYTAATAGVAGNGITVTHLGGVGQTLHAAVADTDHVTVQLATTAHVHATATIGGIVYTATAAGAAGNDITVTHLGGVSQTLHADAAGNTVTVQLGTDADGVVTSAYGDVIDEVAAHLAALVVASGTGTPAVDGPHALATGADGGVVSSTYTDVIDEVAAHLSALVVASGTGTPVAVTATALTGGSDGGVITSSAAQVITEVATHESALVVASGSGPVVVDGTFKNLAGGSDGGVVTSTAAGVHAEVDSHATIAAVANCGITGTPTAASSTHLSGGAAVAITQDAAELVAALNADTETAKLVTASMNTGDGVGHVIDAAENAHLAGGKDATVSVFFAPSYDQYTPAS
jgi:hypothetical protein